MRQTKTARSLSRPKEKTHSRGCSQILVRCLAKFAKLKALLVLKNGPWSWQCKTLTDPLHPLSFPLPPTKKRQLGPGTQVSTSKRLTKKLDPWHSHRARGKPKGCIPAAKKCQDGHGIKQCTAPLLGTCKSCGACLFRKCGPKKKGKLVRKIHTALKNLQVECGPKRF